MSEPGGPNFGPTTGLGDASFSVPPSLPPAVLSYAIPIVKLTRQRPVRSPIWAYISIPAAVTYCVSTLIISWFTSNLDRWTPDNAGAVYGPIAITAIPGVIAFIIGVRPRQPWRAPSCRTCDLDYLLYAWAGGVAAPAWRFHRKALVDRRRRSDPER